ncbi:hypothetical protein D9758_008944 [Tetrapyrgos nigripes]|uniref:HTH CENPB-type domain-containing protein n=1 Tax=Tetrapyrgos nigripes TaxID=182062 RepID=A0A8H5LR81_9AGAR|nr:hypothetical protein D9758_008944 [Tetrapyrgos nigripes]
MKLTAAQEEVLVEWIQQKGWRLVPLSLSVVAKHASIISGTTVGENWVMRFQTRHPELQARWAGGIEKCWAQSLNPVATADYFKELRHLIETYNVQPRNIYNMDEKGVMMGKGLRTMVLVDRDQKDVKMLEDGDHEMATMIECLSADGTCIHSNVIFKANRRDHSWGANNPGNASVDTRCEVLRAVLKVGIDVLSASQEMVDIAIVECGGGVK